MTAQRRAERLQDVPIAITALSADQLAASGVTDVTKLNTITPGLYIQASTGFVSPHIRGIGTSAGGAGLENSVAVYVDGVYMASQPGSLLSLNNVARIEVLKGPQGTLTEGGTPFPAASNPLTYIDRTDPPFLIFHGSNDRIVSPSQTLRLHEALRAAGVSSSRYVLDGAGHGDLAFAGDPASGLPWSTKEAMGIIVRFLHDAK